MATINNSGAQGKTFEQYKTEIEQLYLAIDPSWNIEPESPDGQAIAIWAELLANLDEAAIAAYQSVDPRTATGQQLDRIAAINLLTRQSATFSTVTLDLTGTPSTVVPAGTEFRNTETDTLWASDSEVTLDGAGEATVNATCTTSGAEPASVGTITVIATPVSGLSSVNNPNAASLGRDEESDRFFRARRRNSVGSPGDNQVDSMFAEVANVENVNRVRVYENFESTTDANDVDGNSLAIIVDGGTDADIASAIAAKKNPGCGLNANNTVLANKVTVATTTPAGNPFNATFFRPETTTVYVAVTIDGPYDEAEIKQAIIDYAQGTFFDQGTGFDRDGFSIGDNVPLSKIYTPLNSLLGDGSFVDDLAIGTSPSPTGTATIVIPFNGLAVFDASSITVASA